MWAIQQHRAGSAGELFIGTAATPEPGSSDLLVRVLAAGVNRADILQREGKYPPPAGISDVLGLEFAGRVERAGAAVEGFRPGDRVFGLLQGGGYAEFVRVPAAMVRAIPEGWSFEEAAAVPEVFLTSYQCLRWLGRLESGETLLVHAGGSGVGTAAIQLAKAMGGRVVVTASPGKHPVCLQLGALQAFDYRRPGMWEELADLTSGADVIIDPVGGDYFDENLRLLRPDGRLVMLAVMGGSRAGEVNIGQIVFKRLQITGSTLRSRSVAYQSRLFEEFWTFARPLFAEEKLRPVIDTVFDREEVAEAHRYLESNRNIGKVVLRMG